MASDQTNHHRQPAWSKPWNDALPSGRLAIGEQLETQSKRRGNKLNSMSSEIDLAGKVEEYGKEYDIYLYGPPSVW